MISNLKFLFGTAIITLALTACNQVEEKPELKEGVEVVNVATVTCSDTWYQEVDAQVQSGDGQGHGPDIGSLEWRGVIEFKLGLRGNPNNPSIESEEWCTYIDKQLALQQ